MTQKQPNLEGGVIWARGKRRGFSPGATVRHSQYARLYTEFVQKNTFSSLFELSRSRSRDFFQKFQREFFFKNLG
jgi:hypothetical protein